MKLLQPFKQLKLVNKYLRFAIIALFTFFISESLILESYRIYTIFSGSFILSDLPEVFVYGNFISAFSFIILYLVIKNQNQLPDEKKEINLISLILILLVSNYLFKFFFIEYLFSLRAPGLNIFPNSLTDFFPFDWYDLSQGYADSKSDFDPGWYKLRFLFALVSAISILLAIFYSWKFLHTSKVKPEIKSNLFLIKNYFKSIKVKVVSFSVVILFLLFGIQNIQAEDYRSIFYEVEFTQDDLLKFQDDLKLANQMSFESSKYEARKAAANKIYGSISTRDERLQDIDLSLWSGRLQDFKFGVIEWLVLWEKFLKEMALQGYVESGTIFDLNQKYAEIEKLGKDRAPELVGSWTIDYWDEEFYPLVN
jgi:hypothetical protein